MKSVNASSGRSVDGVVLNPDQRDCSRNVEDLQMTASIRTNSHTDLNGIDETRGSNTVDGVELPVDERDFVRQTHTHHSY